MRKILFIIFISALTVTSVIYSKEKAEIRTLKIMEEKLKITINNIVLTATLYDNATTRSFVKRLPLTLPMKNLYSREMVYRFPDPLPVEEASYRGYEIGEIIYYPPLHSFVIMYAQNIEKFSMQSMGRVDNDVRVLNKINEADARLELVK
jgi:hypothetical protein